MKDKIISISTQVREALEGSKKTDHQSYSSFSIADFPCGCCGDTSEVLQVVLYNRLGITTHYISGTHYSEEGPSSIGNGASHAWLEFEGMIIDITADQFNDRGFQNEAIIVTEASSFHDLFIERNHRRIFNPQQIPPHTLLQTINYVLKFVN